MTVDDAVIEITEFGPPEVLRLAERPTPVPGPGEVLIKVAAAGVNRPDVIQRYGKYPPPPGASDIPGLEVAGHIAALGAGVCEWRDGRRGVRAGRRRRLRRVLRGARRRSACRPPRGSRSVEAAAMPETFFTVWTNVFERGRLARGETMLVHGGSSGIGTTAIQLAEALGARVFATAGTDESARACRGLGADLAVNYRTRTGSQAIQEATGGRGVDVVLDMVGGDYVRAQSRRCWPSKAGSCRSRSSSRRSVELDLMQVMRAAADDHRLHAAAAVAGGKGRDRPRSSTPTSGRCSKQGQVKPIIHAHVSPRAEPPTPTG